MSCPYCRDTGRVHVLHGGADGAATDIILPCSHDGVVSLRGGHGFRLYPVRRPAHVR